MGRQTRPARSTRALLARRWQRFRTEMVVTKVVATAHRARTARFGRDNVSMHQGRDQGGDTQTEWLRATRECRVTRSRSNAYDDFPAAHAPRRQRQPH